MWCVVARSGVLLSWDWNGRTSTSTERAACAEASLLRQQGRSLGEIAKAGIPKTSLHRYLSESR
jgi:hypothetical protein